MNVSLLEQAKYSIMSGPFDMNSWSFCIAHHVASAAHMRDWDVCEVRNVLGIDSHTAARLFHMFRWPTQFLDGYSNTVIQDAQVRGLSLSTTMAKDKERAIRRIDFFIATNGTDQESKEEELPEAAFSPTEELVGV